MTYFKNVAEVAVQGWIFKNTSLAQWVKKLLLHKKEKKKWNQILVLVQGWNKPKFLTLGPFILSAVWVNLGCGASVSDDKTMKNLLTQDPPDHGLWTRDKSFFFKISQLCWPIGQMSIWGYFRIYIWQTPFVIVSP